MSAQTGMPADRRLLDDIVDGLIRRHGITMGDIADILVPEYSGLEEAEIVPRNEGWNGKVEQIALAKAKTLGAETLARIIYAEPNADLYGVHCGTWLGKYESGPYLIQQIAATAIVCQIRAKLGVMSGVREHFEHHTGAAV